MNRCKTFPHRWVMHMWSNGDVSSWNTRNDHLYAARYGGDLAATRERRECTQDELQEILDEQARFQAMDGAR